MELDTRRHVQSLMTRLADGERDAFAPLYEALWPVVRRFAARALPQVSDAEDAAQSALLKVFSAAARFDETQDAVSWVLGIVAYECCTLRQRVRRRKEEPTATLADRAMSGTPEDEAIRLDLEEAAVEIVGTLRPVDLQTLQQVLAGQRPDVSGATFRKRVERALTRFRAAWGARHGND